MNSGLHTYNCSCGINFLSKKEYDEHVVHSHSAIRAHDNPSHYTMGSIQPVEYVRANDLDYYEGSVLKYLTRWPFKGGVEDLKKAQVFLGMLITEAEQGYVPLRGRK